MRNHFSIFVALLGFCSFLFAPPVFSDDLGLVRLSLIEGDVQVLIKDSTDWTDAAENLPLSEGDRIWVADGARAELQVRGGVAVRLDGNTALDILTSTPDSAQFYLDRGHTYINNRRGGIQNVQVDTPRSSVRGYDNSIMMVDAEEDDSVEVSVLKGFAFAESRSGATRVGAGNTLLLRGDADADLAPIGAADEWEQWNTERDRALFAWGDSSRYLPDELHEYASDFDGNGRWDYTADYGYVWTPTIVDAGWAPYTVGNWIWIRGEYVWVAQDPWCWAPSHYGRWVSTVWGWSWVPPAEGAVYWGPGYVGWVVTPAYVAWVPLAPGEVYYGRGNYGPWSRNIATVNVNVNLGNRTFINARGRNSVVVVDRDSFGTGRRRPYALNDNPFLDHQRRPKEDWTVIPPAAKPHHPIVITDRDGQRGDQRNRPPRDITEPHRNSGGGSGQGAIFNQFGKPGAASQPTVQTPLVSKPLVQRPLPPERFRNTRPAEIKNERRLVREREASVFRAHPPENLPVKKLQLPRETIRRPERQASPSGRADQRTNQGEGKDRRRPER